MRNAQKIAEAAVAHPYGVIESNDNNPTMQSNSNLSLPITILFTVLVVPKVTKRM